MKRGSKLFWVFLLIAIILLSFVSAGAWSNFWNKFSGKTTGKAVFTNIQCSDTDNGKDYFVRGFIYGACYDCKRSFEIGSNNYLGYPIGGNSDSCLDDKDNAVNTGDKLREFYCSDNHGYKREIVDCENGCNQGACVSCKDSDNKDIYKKGFIVTNAPSWIPYYGSVTSDTCAFKSGTPYTKNLSCSGDNCYVLEYNCEKNLPLQEPVKCSEGCMDGACIKPEKNCTEDYSYPSYHVGGCSANYCVSRGYLYGGCDRKWIKTNSFGGGYYEYKEICKKNILSRSCSDDKTKLCVNGSWTECATGCSDGACNPSYPEYLIEKDLGNLSYGNSRLNQGYCDIVEKGSCNIYVAEYNTFGVHEVDVGVETHSEVFKNGEAINGFLGEFRRDESIQVGTEAWKGNPYYIFMNENGEMRDVIFAWYSGTNVVLVSLNRWNTSKLNDEDVFDNLLDAYFEKYPSDLVFEEIPPVVCSDSDGGESKYIKGIATGENLNKEQVSESDKCLGNILIEKICRNGYVSDVFVNCENGCDDGACKIVCNYGESDFKPEVREGTLVLDDLKTTKSVDDISLLYSNENQILGFGKNDSFKIAIGENKINFNLDGDSMFIASWVNESFSESYLMRVSSIEENSSGIYATLEYKSNGDWVILGEIEEGSELTLGNISISVDSIDRINNEVHLRAVSENSFFNVLFDFNGNYLGLDYVEGFFPVSNYFLNIFNPKNKMINRYEVSIDNGELELKQACETPTCTDEDEGLYSNVTKSYTYDSFGKNISDSCYNSSILREAVCSQGNASFIDVFCENGCLDGKCLGESNCSDSDNGLNYFEKGATSSCVGGTCLEVINESCVDSDTLWESYCGRNNEVVWQQYLCPNGCENGSCIAPVRRACEPVSLGGPEINPGIKLLVNGTLSYCDPLTLTYQSVKSLNESCNNDYECESNVCIEGKCSSVRGELESQRKILESQTSLLQEIRCWLRDFFRVQDYDDCLNESIGG